MIHTYDRLADECVQILNKMPSHFGPDKPFKKDLYALLRDHASEHSRLQELWIQVNTVPKWVNWEQIQRGQDVFFRYGLPILNVVSPTPHNVTPSLIETTSLALEAYSVACMQSD